MSTIRKSRLKNYVELSNFLDFFLETRKIYRRTGMPYDIDLDDIDQKVNDLNCNIKEKISQTLRKVRT